MLRTSLERIEQANFRSIILIFFRNVTTKILVDMNLVGSCVTSVNKTHHRVVIFTVYKFRNVIKKIGSCVTVNDLVRNQIETLV